MFNVSYKFNICHRLFIFSSVLLNVSFISLVIQGIPVVDEHSVKKFVYFNWHNETTVYVVHYHVLFCIISVSSSCHCFQFVHLLILPSVHFQSIHSVVLPSVAPVLLINDKLKCFSCIYMKLCRLVPC